MLREAAYGTLEVLKVRMQSHLHRPTPEEISLMEQDVPWSIDDRRIVRTALEKVVQDSVAYMGLPPFELPAEYVAATITVFVSPVNYMAACSWTAGGHVFASDLQVNSEPAMHGWEHASAHQLFAMVLELAGDPSFGKVKSELMEKMSVRTQRALQKGV